MVTRVPIPLGQQQRMSSLGLPAARAPMVAVEDRTGAAVAGMGDAGQRVADSWRRVEEEEARAWASKAGAQARLDWMQRVADRKVAAQPGAAGFTDTVRQEFQAFREEALANAPENVRRFYEAQLDDLGTYVVGESIRFQADEQIAQTRDLYQQGALASAAVAAQDPSQYDSLIATQRAILNSSDLPPSMRVDILRTAEREISPAAETGRMRQDPGGYLAARAGGSDANAIINDTIDRFEGTTFVASDGASGAPAKFGINQRANPDVDVASLTRERAVQIYRERYWDAIGGDTLPPAVAAVAFDTAVNMGAGTARALLAEAGGDPARMLELRRERYHRIAQANPAQQPYLQGWLNRVDALERDLQSMGPTASQPSARAPSFNALSWNDQQRLVERAGVLHKQAQAVARAELQQVVNDATASLLSTGRWDGPALTPDRFVAAYGPDEGMQHWQSFQQVRQLGDDIQTVTSLSFAEQEALLASNEPATTTGFADAQRRQQTLAEAIKTVRRQRDADPATSAMASSEAVRGAYVAMTSAAQAGDQDALRAASSNYAAVAVAEQERLGIPVPKVLPESEVVRVSQMLRNYRSDSEDLAVMIGALESQWRDHWPDVYAELVESGDLPQAALVIPNVDNPGVRERIARTANIDEKVMKTRLPEAGVRDIEDQLASNMEEAWTSFSYQGSGPQTYQVIYDTARRLALFYAASGESPRKAADRAYKEILAEQYEFGETYRVPQRELPGEVMAGTSRVLRDLDMDALTMPDSLAGLQDDATRRAYQDVVRNRSIFVTNADETGLDLYVQGEDGPSPVRWLDGTPVSFTWSELRGDGSEDVGEAFIGYRRPGGN
ncbi:MAG: glycosyl hydrolase 108 family protein [Pigmentiphaga sp.]